MKRNKFYLLGKGFTLIEVMIVVLLVAFVFQVSQTFLKNYFRNISFEISQIYRNRYLNKFEAVVSRDLRSANCILCKTLENKTQELIFSSPVQKQIKYFLKNNKNNSFSLIRETTNFSDFKKSDVLLMKTENIKWELFDGIDWKSNWGWDDETHQELKGMLGLPIAVRVTVLDQSFVFPIMVALVNEKLKK